MLATKLDSLFFVVRFPDRQAQLEATRHDVSAHIVKEIVDGRGVKYKNPIEHIALTNYPVIPGLGPWIPDPSDPTGLTYHKELLPEGDWWKESDDLDFSISLDYLDHAIETQELMQQNGVAIPIQLTHEGDGNKKGEVLQFYKGQRSKQFSKKPVGKLSKKSAARVLSLSKGSNKMTLDQLCELLGIPVTPDMDDAAKEAAIKAKVQQVNPQAVAASQQPSANGAGTGAQGQPAVTALSNTQADMSHAQAAAQQVAQHAINAGLPQQQQQAQQGAASSLDPRKVAMTVSLSAKNAVKAGMEAQINDLVANYGMTPVQAEMAKQRYCSDERVLLSLSRSADDNSPDAFTDFIETWKAGEGQTWQSSGRTLANDSQVSLALARSGGKSPLLANREKRNEQFKQFMHS